MGFTIKFESKLPALIKRLDKLDGTELSAGFYEEDRYGPENHNLSVATVAAMNEFGTKYNPTRPFMSDAFSDSMNQLYMARGMKNVFIDVIKGGTGSQRLMNTLGKLTAGMIQYSIQDYASRGGNSAATIALKKGRDTPLIDSGKMLESVKFYIHR